MIMSRIYFWLSFIIIATSNIRFTNAANCTSTTYNQQLDPTQLALSQTTPEDFANATGTQLTDRLKELFNETLVSINCTIAKSTTSINVGYNIVYGCNETTATVLANGTTKTVPVNTNLNKTRVDQVVSCGLFDFLKSFNERF
jgi:muramidase (phage lysozyme)